jgi:hypothetical protein
VYEYVLGNPVRFVDLDGRGNQDQVRGWSVKDIKDGYRPSDPNATDNKGRPSNFIILHIFPINLIAHGVEAVRDTLTAPSDFVDATLNEDTERQTLAFAAMFFAVPNGESGCGSCASSTCFVAGTLVATPHGAVPIETIVVGQRVSSAVVDGQPVGPSVEDVAVQSPNSLSWRSIDVDVVDFTATGGHVYLTLLRPVSWIAENHVVKDSDVVIDLSEIGVTASSAHVVNVGPAPEIERGAGRLVLATLTHPSESVVKISFEGNENVLESTSVHKFYSLDRNDWVAAQNLRSGERLQSGSGATFGTVVVRSVEPVAGRLQVYNLEVDGEHTYRVGRSEVASHNTCKLEPYSKVGGHHVPAKAGLRDAENYSIGGAPAISEAEMATAGVKHTLITDAQRVAYIAFRKAGGTLDWTSMAKIEIGALVSAGMKPKLAKQTVNAAIKILKAAGVPGPTRIPWAPSK